jgi:hypothetical protein
MIAVADVDRLVADDDGIAAGVWPRLGARVRKAYVGDRNAWLAARKAAEGSTPPAALLARHHRVFDGWARAFRAARRQAVSPATRHQAAQHRRRQPTPAAATTAVPPPTAASPSSPPASQMGTGTKVAIAGGLLLLGAAALAGRRKRT